MAHHVGGVYAFGRVRVMGAAGGVNVVIAGPPAGFGRVDPALEGEGGRLIFLTADLDLRSPGKVFGTAGVFDRVLAPGEFDRLAVGAIDLRMKREVRGEALGLRGVDVTLLVAEDEAGGDGAG